MVIQLSGAARRDLEDIRRYTTEHWGRDHWLQYFIGLSDAFERITQNPDCGRPQDFLHKGLRSLPFGQHLIFYYPVQHAAGASVILRILHQKRNWTAMSFQADLEL